MSNTTSSSSTGKPYLSSSGINNNGGDHGTTKAAANLSKWLFQDIDFIEESLEAVKRKADEMLAEVQEERKKLQKLDEDGTEAEGRDTQLKEVKKKVSKLRLAIPFKFITLSQPHYPNINWRPRPDPSHIREITPSDLAVQKYSRRRPVYEEPSRQEEGTYYKKYMLLCFIQFPPNAVIKRSILFGWMNASPFSHLQRSTSVRVFDKTIDDLIAKGSIVAVQKKCSLTVAGYRTDKSTHSTHIRMVWPSLFHSIEDSGICLGPSIDEEEEEDYDVFYTGSSSRGQLHARKFLRVLHLGKWNKSSTQHIEFVDNPDVFFEKDVPYLTWLRYISFRGISMIQELPIFITKLGSLEVLDVQACYNLEVIPSDIGNLRRTLRHLDMSECYFLDHMPKALATLDRLEVLKGFFVGEVVDERRCSLEDLSPLGKLVKLNIYTNVKEFPNTSQLTALQKFQRLQSLTISWGGCKSSAEDKYEGEFSNTRGVETFRFNLEKLDLQCVPKTVRSSSRGGWLNPTNFRNLRRLYIRGGNFSDLGESTSCRWDVEILRLKHLGKLKMEWTELRRLFPKLMCLENVDCPQLVGIPHDRDGVWTKDAADNLHPSRST